MSEVMLNKVFEEVGREHGYDSITAEFGVFKEFKVKWKRSMGWAEFEVSDYLKGAPEEVLRDLAEMIFDRIGRKPNAERKAFKNYVATSEFLENTRPKFLARSRNMSHTTEGESKDLLDSYRRLIDMGLVEEDKDIVFTWTLKDNRRKLANTSVLMKVITISRRLDGEMVPDCLLDYVLYSQLLNIEDGFDPMRGDESKEERKSKLREFPQREEAEKMLKKIGGGLDESE